MNQSGGEFWKRGIFFCEYDECPCICYEKEWTEADEPEPELPKYTVYNRKEKCSTDVDVAISPRTNNPDAHFQISFYEFLVLILILVRPTYLLVNCIKQV